VALPVEFTLDAMEDIDDLPRVARVLSRVAEAGRVACGQPDPWTREVRIDGQRVLYRLEHEQIVVLGADLEPLH